MAELVNVRTFRNNLATIIATGKCHVLGDSCSMKAIVLPVAARDFDTARSKRAAKRKALRDVRSAFKTVLHV